jgi:hypothetical protein
MRPRGPSASAAGVPFAATKTVAIALLAGTAGDRVRDLIGGGSSGGT